MNTVDQVSPRSGQLLKTLIERHIESGQPVSSKALASENVVALSAASIRNLLAELEQQGFLQSPHTSAGRVPTAQGYRFFVDTLLTIKPMSEALVERLSEGLDPDKSAAGLIETASNLVSSITSLAGLVTLPKSERMVLRQIEFLPLTSERILVITVLNNKEVQNRVIHSEQAFTAAQLQQAANYLNHHFVGCTLHEARAQLLAAMRDDSQHLHQAMQGLLDVATKALSIDEADGYVVAGERNLLNAGEGNEHAVQELFQAFSQKQDILQLLDRCLSSEGVQLFIGEESGYKVFDDYSLITAPYQVEGQQLGVLAVLGPTRMAYDKVIPAVDATAKVLSGALNHF